MIPEVTEADFSISRLTMIGGEAVDDVHVIPQSLLIFSCHQWWSYLSPLAFHLGCISSGEEQVVWWHFASHRQTTLLRWANHQDLHAVLDTYMNRIFYISGTCWDICHEDFVSQCDQLYNAHYTCISKSFLSNSLPCFNVHGWLGIDLKKFFFNIQLMPALFLLLPAVIWCQQILPLKHKKKNKKTIYSIRKKSK